MFLGGNFDKIKNKFKLKINKNIVAKEKQKARIISVDMGYGHQRTAHSLKELAYKGKIINANSYEGIPEKDRKIWESFNEFYDFISQFKRFPFIGDFFFFLFDQFQKIADFYPKRNLSKPNFSVKRTYDFIEKGWGSHLIGSLGKETIPLICTFYVPAFMAEYFDYPGDIYCVVCDADVSRAWVPKDPYRSRIKYFAPTERVVKRLKLYGVRPENIYFTGYPLPISNVGKRNLGILKRDLAKRLLVLDPKRKYFSRYESLIKKYLKKIPKKKIRPLTIMFAVGGAGAQKEIGFQILKGLKEKIRTKKVRLVLVAGIRSEVKDYFLERIRFAGMEDYLDKGIKIIFKEKINDYFDEFNSVLRKTDIVWTKPSELSFFSGLGLPIIMAPCIGSQERFNKRWLLNSGFAIEQRNPVHADEWLFDYLDQGWLAEAAMEGFIETEKRGFLTIKKIISKKE